MKQLLAVIILVFTQSHIVYCDGDFNTDVDKSEWKDISEELSNNLKVSDFDYETTPTPLSPLIQVTEIYNYKKEETITTTQSTCAQHISSISTKQYSSNRMRGGIGGTWVAINKNGEKQGRVVRSIKVHAWTITEEKIIGGLEIELSDGSYYNYGTKSQSQSEPFYFYPEEYITSMYLKDNGVCTVHGRITGIRFYTNKNRHFLFDGNSNNNWVLYPNIGSGILVGLHVRYGVAIDGLGFLFLPKVHKSILTNVEYPNISSLTVTTKPLKVERVIYDNKYSSFAQEYTLTGSKLIQESFSWSIDATLAAKLKQQMMINASKLLLQIPKPSSQLNASVQKGNSLMYRRTVTSNVTQMYSVKIKLAAGKRIAVTGTIYQGVINTPYTGVIHIHLITGNNISYPVKGIYSSITTSKVQFTVKDA